MTATTLYRVSAGVFVLFAAGHTFGFLRFKPPTPEGRAAQAAMYSTIFEIGGSKFTLGGFYVGFGLSCTVSLLFSAFLAWQLANLAVTQPRGAAVIGWALFAVQLAGIWLSGKYFGLPPLVFSVSVAALVGAAAWQVSRTIG